MEFDTTYTPPDILNDMDEETIHSRMLSVIPNNLDKTEGGFVYDFTMPTAIEKADAMIILNEIVQLFFPEWSRLFGMTASILECIVSSSMSFKISGGVYVVSNSMLSLRLPLFFLFCLFDQVHVYVEGFPVPRRNDEGRV